MEPAMNSHHQYIYTVYTPSVYKPTSTLSTRGTLIVLTSGVLGRLVRVSASLLVLNRLLHSMEARSGTTISLAALSPSASRSKRLAMLRDLENGLRSDGWVRLTPDAELIKATRAMYDASAATFADSNLCQTLRRDALLQADSKEQHLALTYLGLHEEPLYDAGAAAQCVHSLNVHEVLTPSELDARLPHAYDGEERMLAHAYHSADTAGGSIVVPRLLSAAAVLRAILIASVCAPLLSAFDALLGLDDGSLARRCRGEHSDNTSLLRCLEYPRAERGDGGGGHSGDGEGSEATSEDGVWGVSAHTDFGLFSLLHEDAPGLTLQDPSGAWVRPCPCTNGGPKGADSSTPGEPCWVVLVGDMLARLSCGYLMPTPHRVPRTESSAPRPRRALVFFNALDELEFVKPLSAAVACRSATGGFRRWWEDGGFVGGPASTTSHLHSLAKPARAPQPQPYQHPWAQLLQPEPMTQREWTELKELAARERLETAAAPPGTS